MVEPIQLIQTRDCPKCQRAGGDCDVCFGSGIILDERLTSTILKYGLTKQKMAQLYLELVDFFGVKISESYDRGFYDGVRQNEPLKEESKNE